MTFDEVMQETINKEVNLADEAGARGRAILEAALPVSTSDHAAGWALLAIYHEISAARMGVLDELTKIRAALEATAATTELSAPRRRGGSL